MSGIPSTKDLEDALAEIEAQTQDYLLRRPPPFFVQRKLILTNVPEDRRVPLLREIFPSVDNPNAFDLAALTDFVAFTQRDDVACLNRYFFADLPAVLAGLIGQCRGLLHEVTAADNPFLVYCCAEILGFLLAEKCYWEFLSQPFVRVRFDKATLSEAQDFLSFAFQPAKLNRDWLRWHRITANQARLGFLVQDQAKALGHTFNAAISLGQLCLDHGYPVDRAFPLRRDELLHMAGIIKVFQKDPTYLNLCAHIKSPGRIKPQPGGMRFTVESGAFIGNFSMPLLLGMQESVSQHGHHTAFVDFLALEDRVQVWMAFKGQYPSQAYFYRDLHRHSNLDLIFRPSQFEVMLRGENTIPDGESEGRNRTERIAQLTTDYRPGSLNSEVVTGMQWVLRFPVLEMDFDEDGQPDHRDSKPELMGVPWERTLGGFLAHVLPDDEDLEHLVVSTDGPLALLPFHLSLLPDGRLLTDRYKVSYAPSAAYFSPAPMMTSREDTKVAVVLNSHNRLEGPIWELGRFRKRLTADTIRTLDGFDGDRDAIQSQLGDRDIIHIATHGHTFTATPEVSGIELVRGRVLSVSAIETLVLKPGCLVFLNACGSNRVTIQSRIQFSSIANAFLAAGAATVIATFWETDDVAAALLSDRFYMHLLEESKGRLESLDLALDWLRNLDLDQVPETDLGKLAVFLPLQRKQPYSNPSHWGQSALFGHW